MNNRIIFLSVALTALAACTNAKTATEEDFGNSLASLQRAQAANPSKISSPSTEPVTGVDPDYAGNVIEAMRENVSQPEKVKEPIEIRVGGQSQGGN